MKVLVTVEIETPDNEDESKGGGCVWDRCWICLNVNYLVGSIAPGVLGDPVVNHPYNPKIISSHLRLAETIKGPASRE